MRLFVLVNGILTFPGSADNWTGRMATGLIRTTHQPVEKIEYLSFATLHRLLGQRNRVHKLARTLSFYVNCPAWEIVLVAHSNGATVVLDALRYLDWPAVSRIVFFSPACSRDFRKNGLRAAQETGRIKDVTVLIGGKDFPLRMADTAMGRFLGYGDLGKDGPVNHLASATQIIRRSEWGHSEWWTDANLPWSLEIVCKNV